MKFKKGSSNTGDYTVKDDPTHENYMALLTAIMIEEDTPDYKKLVYNKLLFDKREEKRRLEEIDEIRAKGGKTELEVWYRKSIEKYCKNGKESLFVQREFKKEAERRAEKNLQKKNELFNKFSQNTIDIESLDINDIRKYKIKVVNVETGEVTLYETRQECARDLGVCKKNVITYMKLRYLYNKKYLFYVSDQKVSDEIVKKLKIITKRTKYINKVTGEKVEFERLREASQFFNINYSTFQAKLKKGLLNQIGDWELINNE